MSILLKKRTMIQYGVIPSCMLWFLFGTLTCACLIQVGLLRSPRQAHARTANKRKRKIQSRAVAESPAEPLGRTSAITLGGFLDRFSFWTFVEAPLCEIVSPRIITVRPREKTVQLIIITRQPRQLTFQFSCAILFMHYGCLGKVG